MGNCCSVSVSPFASWLRGRRSLERRACLPLSVEAGVMVMRAGLPSSGQGAWPKHPREKRRGSLARFLASSGVHPVCGEALPGRSSYILSNQGRQRLGSPSRGGGEHALTCAQDGQGSRRRHRELNPLCCALHPPSSAPASRAVLPTASQAPLSTARSTFGARTGDGPGMSCEETKRHSSIGGSGDNGARRVGHPWLQSSCTSKSVMAALSISGDPPKGQNTEHPLERVHRNQSESLIGSE